MRDLDEKARQAKEKKAGLGPDIDLDAYESGAVAHEYMEDLHVLSEADKKRMILAGIDSCHTRAGGKGGWRGDVPRSGRRKDCPRGDSLSHVSRPE